MKISRSDILNREYISQCFEIDYKEGVLWWKHRPLAHFPNEKTFKIWNTKYAGKRAGSPIDKKSSIYWRVTISKQYFYVHQIVWLLFYGWLPDMLEYKIDHRDRNSENNSITNLRFCTQKENSWNMLKDSNSLIGTSFDKARDKWMIQFRGISGKISGRYSNEYTAAFIYDVLCSSERRGFAITNNLKFDDKKFRIEELSSKMKNILLKIDVDNCEHLKLINKIKEK